MAIEVLRAILARLPTGGDAPRSPFAPDALRYTLEYPDNRMPLDLDGERQRLADYLDSDRFVLAPLDPETLPEFAVLTFPGLERVLPQTITFDIGYAIADSLRLESCEPDLGTDFYFDPEEPPPTATEAARVVSTLCLADAEPPSDPRWALVSARIDRAWTFSRGAGIVIAQPDTGVATHSELPKAGLGLDRAMNILTGEPDPADPLQPGMANPGHGTATGSVAAGDAAGRICGAAPGATLVPIRCIDDVKVFNAAPVAKAIAHAVAIRADVIALSLGGVPSRAVHKAVREAVAAGVVVIAAAGNCVRTVVWPARYDEVIAVGGTNASDRPWRGSSRGSSVDICAPAEFVWVARRELAEDRDLARIEAGQGTSYAAALTAGAAALWLAHHGRAEVRREAERRGMSVHSLLRAALRATARVPQGWDREEFGAGILDAEKLLGLALNEIPGGGGIEASGGQTDGARDFLLEELGSPRLPASRYFLEIAAIGLRQRTQGATLQELSAESKRPGTFASTHLREAVRTSGDPELQRLLQIPGTTSLADPVFAAPVREIEPGVALHTKTSRLEAAGEGLTPAQARDYLRAKGRAEQMARLDKRLADADQSDPEFLDAIRQRVGLALDTMAGNRPLDGRARVGLEALVLLNGRPALRVRDSRIDFNDPLIGDWHDRLFIYFGTSELPKKISAIGRIDADDIHWGTGFVVGDGLVLTNRHVLQEIAAPIPRKNDPDRWQLTSTDTFIDFADEPAASTSNSKFRVLEVIDAGAKDIDPYLLDFTKVDAALLRVESANASGSPLPPAISLVSNPDATARSDNDVLTIGYPAMPSTLPRGADGQVDMEVSQRLQELFGAKYGRKYLSPGKLVRLKDLVFFHDATTLGGCSGSPVLRTDTSFDAIGLHFGGLVRTDNYAHDLPGLALLPTFLSANGVVWVSP